MNAVYNLCFVCDEKENSLFFRTFYVVTTKTCSTGVYLLLTYVSAAYHLTSHGQGK